MHEERYIHVHVQLVSKYHGTSKSGVEKTRDRLNSYRSSKNFVFTLVTVGAFSISPLTYKTNTQMKLGFKLVRKQN